MNTHGFMFDPNSSIRPDFVRKNLCRIKLGTRTIVSPNVLFLSSHSQRQHERSVYWVRSKKSKVKNVIVGMILTHPFWGDCADILGQTLPIIVVDAGCTH